MLLVKNAQYLGASVDLLTDNEKVVTMTPAGHCQFHADEVFDAHGLWLMPAFIDAHVHLREPGYEYKEDINTGLAAAAHGGFGAVMCMANTKPVNDNAAVTQFMRDQARKSHPAGPSLYPIAAATIGLGGEEMTPLAEMKNAGCIAVSNDGQPLRDTDLTRHIMEYASDLGMVFIDHCEDPWLARGWVMNEGKISGELGLKGQPTPGEAIQAARDILLAEYLDLPVHIAHVSSALTVDIIAWAKSRGVRVTAETCPHYLFLDETSLADFNSLAKVSPPLRTRKDRDALLRALKEGIIDILATDHAPHAAHEKNDVLQNAPCGFIGLEFAIPLTFSLVEDKSLTQADLHRLWGSGPASIFGLPFNEFNPGSPADFILFDPDAEWRITGDNLHSKSHNTPFLGQAVKGRVIHHWHDGKRLF